ncbi:MAG: helix-turn-helix domain-containing protein [Bacteroidales bacterium]|nr:helix-turn-helix domain-containing protein [Bacteroidales bacterium]
MSKSNNQQKNPDIIFNNLKILRRKMNMTQAELAEKVGLHRLSYANIECGKTELINPHLPKIADVLHSSLQVILFTDLSEGEDMQAALLCDGDPMEMKYASKTQDRINSLKEENRTIRESLARAQETIAQLKAVIASKDEVIRCKDELLTLYNTRKKTR